MWRGSVCLQCEFGSVVMGWICPTPSWMLCCNWIKIILVTTSSLRRFYNITFLANDVSFHNCLEVYPRVILLGVSRSKVPISSEIRHLFLRFMLLKYMLTLLVRPFVGATKNHLKSFPPPPQILYRNFKDSRNHTTSFDDDHWVASHTWRAYVDQKRKPRQFNVASSLSPLTEKSYTIWWNVFPMMLRLPPIGHAAGEVEFQMTRNDGNRYDTFVWCFARRLRGRTTWPVHTTLK